MAIHKKTVAVATAVLMVTGGTAYALFQANGGGEGTAGTAGSSVLTLTAAVTTANNVAPRPAAWPLSIKVNNPNAFRVAPTYAVGAASRVLGVRISTAATLTGGATNPFAGTGAGAGKCAALLGTRITVVSPVDVAIPANATDYGVTGGSLSWSEGATAADDKADMDCSKALSLLPSPWTDKIPLEWTVTGGGTWPV